MDVLRSGNREPTGWKRILQGILYPSGGLIALFVLLAIAGLVFAFRMESETHPFQLCAYAFSAYTLLIVCLKIPVLMKAIQNLLNEKTGVIDTGNERLDAVIRVVLDYEQRSRYLLYFSLGFNLLYAVFKLTAGIYYHSFWMGALGIYYAVLSMLRFSLMRSLRGEDEYAGRRVYRRTAWELNFLTLVMSGIFVQMVLQNRSYQYPGVLIYVMALWAFSKIISAVVNLIKRRKDENKALAAARSLSFAGALMSILALQTAMISQFGENQADFAFLMNAIGCGVVTALLITLSALMIARSSEWKKEDAPSGH